MIEMIVDECIYARLCYRTCRNMASTLRVSLVSLAGEVLASSWLMLGERGALFGLIPPRLLLDRRRLRYFLVM